MTNALCLACGQIKFGALVPCSCGAGPSGNMELDILFSDHHYSNATLEGFGAVIRMIREKSSDPEVTLWTFIHYISERYPQILKASIPADLEQDVHHVLDGMMLPQVMMEEPVDGERS